MKTPGIALLLVFTLVPVIAQDLAPVTPAFDVVVLKRNTSGERGMSAGNRPGGVTTVVNGTISTIFGNAVSGLAGRFVVDRTGLPGDYEFIERPTED